MDKAKIARSWRERADNLDAYARTLRREHYLADAEDAEQAANDYRIAADELELHESPFTSPPLEEAEPGLDVIGSRKAPAAAFLERFGKRYGGGAVALLALVLALAPAAIAGPDPFKPDAKASISVAYTYAQRDGRVCHVPIHGPRWCESWRITARKVRLP